VIETERLILRAPEPRDLAWQLEWLNTAAVMRYLGGATRPVETLSAGFERNAASMAKGELAFFTVVLRESGAIIGKCGFSQIEEERAPLAIRGAVQIGWSLAEPFWGQGLASEAALAALGHGFDAFGVEAIWAQTSDSNLASTRVMARLGLTRCPELSYSDPDYPPADNPAIVYRIQRGEWAARA
jgi:RimJ/RimL family protein N-acetyltransferase